MKTGDGCGSITIRLPLFLILKDIIINCIKKYNLGKNHVFQSKIIDIHRLILVVTISILTKPNLYRNSSLANIFFGVY